MFYYYYFWLLSVSMKIVQVWKLESACETKKISGKKKTGEKPDKRRSAEGVEVN